MPTRYVHVIIITIIIIVNLFYAGHVNNGRLFLSGGIRNR